jgi:hypothetical protein
MIHQVEERGLLTKVQARASNCPFFGTENPGRPKKTAAIQVLR